MKSVSGSGVETTWKRQPYPVTTDSYKVLQYYNYAPALQDGAAPVADIMGPIEFGIVQSVRFCVCAWGLPAGSHTRITVCAVPRSRS